jgi:adenylate cyclase
MNQRYWGVGLELPESGDIDKRSYLVPRVVEAANRAVELDPQSVPARLSLFRAYWLTCQPDRMRVEAEAILALNPNNATALLSAGDEEYGRKLAEKALTLAGPAAPRWWWGAIGNYHYRRGEYSEALDAFRKAYSESNWMDHMRLLATLPHLGRIDEARAEIPSALKLRPDMSVHEYDRWVKMFCPSADFRQRIAAALRLAGLREEADGNHALEAAPPSSQR